MKQYLFSRKTIQQTSLDYDSKHSMKKTLGIWSLIAFGVGAVVGAGLFARTAEAAAQGAGAGVVFSFILAAIACAFAGLCYAELSSFIPASGSSYSYAYVSMGQMAAWIVGSALLQEYTFAAPAVAIVATEYINTLTGNAIPYEWIHSPFQLRIQSADGSVSSIFSWDTLPDGAQVIAHGFFNLPAVVILALLSLLLIRGTRESSFINIVMVGIKVGIVLLFVFIGYQFMVPENHAHFYIPKGAPPHDTFLHYGWSGILFGASTVFFAFIGFDSVSTTAQEVKNPQRDMPRGILGSLIICLILYVIFGYVLTGILSVDEMSTRAQEAPIAFAVSKMVGYTWLKAYLEIAIIASFLTVLLTMLYGQSRILLSMSKDGVLPRFFGKIHKKYQTPYMASIVTLVFSTVLSASLPITIAGNMTSFGTLFAFISVCVSVMVMRRTHQDVVRPFRAPWVPFVPIMGIIFCLVLVISLDVHTKIISAIWMGASLLVFFIRYFVLRRARHKKREEA